MYNQNFYYKDASMLGVIAPRGVGKTLLLTCLAYEELRAATNENYDGFRIFHNGFINEKWPGWRIPGEKKPRLQRFGIEDIIETKDSNRSFTVQEKEAKLAEQNFVCAIDGKPLTWEDSHAAHITAHANGGHTVYSNLAMVRICYNKEMGSINLNDYKAMLEKKAA